MLNFDWAILQAPVLGAIGYFLAKVIDVLKERYDEARKAKSAQATKEDILTRRLYNWMEHGYAVRRIAIENGISPDKLPRKPDENDDS